MKGCAETFDVRSNSPFVLQGYTFKAIWKESSNISEVTLGFFPGVPLNTANSNVETVWSKNAE